MQLNPQGAQALMARFDFTKMEVDRARALGLPAKYIISDEDYAQAQQAQQAQMQQMQQMQMMQQMADMGQKIGNTPGGEAVTQSLFGQLGAQLGEATGEQVAANG